MNTVTNKYAALPAEVVSQIEEQLAEVFEDEAFTISKHPEGVAIIRLTHDNSSSYLLIAWAPNHILFAEDIEELKEDLTTMADEVTEYKEQMASVQEILADQPAWITRPLSVSDVAAIVEGGCDSGAYMPAVTYSQALETMNDHGDDVLEYIEDQLGEIPQPSIGSSWSGIAVFYLSCAVELYASSLYSQLEDLGLSDKQMWELQ